MLGFNSIRLTTPKHISEQCLCVHTVILTKFHKFEQWTVEKLDRCLTNISNHRSNNNTRCRKCNDWSGKFTILCVQCKWFSGDRWSEETVYESKYKQWKIFNREFMLLSQDIRMSADSDLGGLAVSRILQAIKPPFQCRYCLLENRWPAYNSCVRSCHFLAVRRRIRRYYTSLVRWNAQGPI